MENNKNIENDINNQNVNNLIEFGEIKLLFWLSAVIFGTLGFVFIKTIGILGQFMNGFGGMLGGAVDGYNSIRLLTVLFIVFGIAMIINIAMIFNIRSKALNSNNAGKMNIPNYANPFRLAISGIVVLAILILLFAGLVPEPLLNLIIIVDLIAIIACLVFSALTLVKNYPVVFPKNNVENSNNINSVNNSATENTGNNSQDISNNQEKANSNTSNINSTSRNTSQLGFLDNILQKDNENNKLFLKIIFWLSTISATILLYGGIKAWSLYSNAKKLASEANSTSSLDNLFNSGMNTLGEGIGFISTAKTLQSLLNLIIIAVIVVSILIYLKAKKENKVSKLKNLNYYFIGGFGILGLIEMYSVNAVIKAFSSLAGMWGAATGSAPNMGLTQFAVITTFLASLGSAVTNYFLVFKGKNVEVGDIKSEFNTGMEKINAMDPEKKKKYKTIGIAAIGIIALYYICTNFIFLKNFDFNKYYTVRIDGISGNATIHNYENPNSPLKTVHGNKAKPTKEEEFSQNAEISFVFSKIEGIKNGDTIDVDISYNKDIAKKLKIRPKNSKFKIKVNGLPEYAKDVNQVKDFKNYVTKLAQRKIETENDENPYRKRNLASIYYKQDENGDLSVKYFINVISPGFLGNVEHFEQIEIGKIVLDKNKNITSYEEIVPKGIIYSKTYSNIGEVQATMNSEGYTLLN